LQQLHLVGFTTEHDALIFSARKGAKSGGFVVALDDRLYDTIDEAGRRRDGEDGDDEPKRSRRSAPRPESALSPRDIQMRLRAGRSVANVASEAGVDEEWVMRFAAPILAEQALVIAKAHKLVFAKARLGSSGRPLAESVWWNVADKGVMMAEDTFDQCWTANHLRDSMWIVRFDFINRKKRQRAEWEVDTREGTLTARNRLGSELGYIEPGRRGRPPAPLPPAAKTVPKPPPPKRSAAAPVLAVRAPAKKRPAAKKTAAKKTAKRPAAKKTAKRPAAKKTAKRVPAKRPAAKKRAPAKRAPARKAAARKGTPIKRTAAKKSAPRRPAPKRAAATRPAKKRAAAKRPAAKRPGAKRAPRVTKARPLKATPEPAFATPGFDPGEPTRPVTIRAARASQPEVEAPPAEAPVALPESDVGVAEPAPLPPPPVLTSTPTPGPAKSEPEARRFGRLRRRRPPGG
jgi:hypothetical protein